MGPIGGQKKRKKTQRRSEVNVFTGSGSSHKDWVHEFSRRINGVQSPSKGLDEFKQIFKISRKTFNYICSLVKEDMLSQSREFTFLNGKLLSLHDQVAVALRRLGSGDSLITVADSFGVNHSTVSQVTWRFVESMEERSLHHLRWPKSEAEMDGIKRKFEILQGFPNCCGVIDTTHIMMLISQSESGIDTWLDSNGNHSMVLQAIVDPNLRFLDIVTGFPGKMEDWEVFQSSNIYKLCDNGDRLNGKKIQLGEEGSELQEYIIGDASYPLLPYLMVPYEGDELTEAQVEFNKRHTMTHAVARRALAMLKDTWRVIQRVMWRPDKHRLPRIILACCLLHNIAIDLEDQVQDILALLPFNDDHGPGYEQQVCEVFDLKAASLRDKLALNLIGRSTTPAAL